MRDDMTARVVPCGLDCAKHRKDAKSNLEVRSNMAKAKADSDKRGWFARWRERRARNKQRASEIAARIYEERRAAGPPLSHRGPIGPVGGP